MALLTRNTLQDVTRRGGENNGISNFGTSHQFAGVNFTNNNLNGPRGIMTPRDSGSGSSQ
jgi:hypothetical protein